MHAGSGAGGSGCFVLWWLFCLPAGASTGFAVHARVLTGVALPSDGGCARKAGGAPTLTLKTKGVANRSARNRARGEHAIENSVADAAPRA